MSAWQNLAERNKLRQDASKSMLSDAHNHESLQRFVAGLAEPTVSRFAMVSGAEILQLARAQCILLEISTEKVHERIAYKPHTGQWCFFFHCPLQVCPKSRTEA